MTIEDQIRQDLHAVASPPGLVPPTDLADQTLRGVRRQRRNRVGLVAAAVVVLTVGGAAAVPVLRSTDTGSTPSGFGTTPPPSPADKSEPPPREPGGAPIFPTPGGGPQAIHLYRADEPTPGTYLLDVATGSYRTVPYEALLSPDLRTVAVTAGDKVGVVDRAALLRGDTSAIRWTRLPVGNGLAWSPDGKALLTTSLRKVGGLRFTAHRYDVASGSVTATPIRVELLGSSVGWAADSRRYIALLHGKSGTDTVEPGALQYVNPDGTLGSRIEITGGGVGGATSYSPAGRYLIADSSQLMTAVPVPSKIVEVGTGTVVREIAADRPLIGWYDETTVVRIAPGSADQPVLDLIDVITGQTVKQVAAPGLTAPVLIQLGSSAGLTGKSATLGF